MDRKNIENFIIQKIETENDNEMLADILQTLGTIKSKKALPIAYDFLNHDNAHHREVALFVIGWLGGKSDIDTLNKHMLNEKAPLLRITAASAHRQIAWRDNNLKSDVLNSLKIGFENETDEKVLSWIIVMIGTVAIKRLGLREDKDDPDKLHGDLQKAKIKTEAFLKTI